MPNPKTLQPLSISQFQKCGEILTTLYNGKNVYTFNCVYCCKIFLELKTFTIHIEIQHKNFKESVDNEMKIQSNIQNGLIEISEPITEECDNIELLIDEDNKLENSDTAEEENWQIESNTSQKNETENENVETLFMLPQNEVNNKNEEICKILLENDNLIQIIIECCSKNITLWDGSKSLLKNREEVYVPIISKISKDFNKQVEENEIDEYINQLRIIYNLEIQKVNESKNKCEQYKPPWYFKKLNELEIDLEKILGKAKLSFPFPDLSYDLNKKFIEIYKNFPCLWDVYDIDYRLKQPREQAMEMMIVHFKERIGLDINQEKMRKKIARLRCTFVREKQRKLQCDKDGIIFHPLCKLYEDLSFLYPHIGPFKCEYCDLIFNAVGPYFVHRSTHDGSMPFVCKVCKRGFSSCGNYVVHLRRHKKEFPFKCDVCNKGFVATNELRVHMRHHTGEKPYICDICGQSFRTSAIFSVHIRRHEKKHSHKCEICSKGFYSTHRLKDHMNAHLNLRLNKCDICGKTFTSTKFLKQHKDIHEKQKKYSCKLCGKLFAQYSGLCSHIKTHGTTLSALKSFNIDSRIEESVD